MPIRARPPNSYSLVYYESYRARKPALARLDYETDDACARPPACDPVFP